VDGYSKPKTELPSANTGILPSVATSKLEPTNLPMKGIGLIGAPEWVTILASTPSKPNFSNNNRENVHIVGCTSRQKTKSRCTTLMVIPIILDATI
jgi:hypothetical protein